MSFSPCLLFYSTLLTNGRHQLQKLRSIYKIKSLVYNYKNEQSLRKFVELKLEIIWCLIFFVYNSFLCTLWLTMTIANCISKKVSKLALWRIAMCSGFDILQFSQKKKFIFSWHSFSLWLAPTIRDNCSFQPKILSNFDISQHLLIFLKSYWA